MVVAKRGRVGVESLHGQVVQEGGAAASDGQEKGLRGLLEDVLHVQLGGFGTDAGPTIRHGPVPAEDAQELLPVRLRSSKELQLPAQVRALAAPHGTQMPHDELLPTGAVARASAVHAPKLVEVTQEDQGGPPLRVVPEPRELDAVSAGQHPSGARDAHVRPSLRRSTDGHFHGRALARTCRPQHAEGAGDLSAQCGQSFAWQPGLHPGVAPLQRQVDHRPHLLHHRVQLAAVADLRGVEKVVGQRQVVVVQREVTGQVGVDDPGTAFQYVQDVGDVSVAVALQLQLGLDVVRAAPEARTLQQAECQHAIAFRNGQNPCVPELVDGAEGHVQEEPLPEEALLVGGIHRGEPTRGELVAELLYL